MDVGGIVLCCWYCVVDVGIVFVLLMLVLCFWYCFCVDVDVLAILIPKWHFSLG